MGHRESVFINGVQAPSVTQVLNIVDKPFLRMWYGKNGIAKCEQIKREAGDFGKEVHKQIENILLGNMSTATGRASELVNLFQQWKEQSGFKPLEIERKVESKEFTYHGTLDSIGTFGSEPSLFVLDWKTSSKIDDLYGCQLAAYAYAYGKETGRSITAGGVVRLEKDATKKPQLEVKTFTDLPRYFDVFKACLAVYQFIHPAKREK